MARFRIALCQINAVVGDVAGNTARVISEIEKAEAQDVDLAIFPELVLAGYPPEDLLLEESFVSSVARGLDEVAAATGRTVAVVGFVDHERELYNAAAVISGGKVHGVWRKELLPNYGVFDERRWFVPGNGDTPLFEVAGVNVGVTICEDAWSPSGPIARQAAGGADLVVSLNASPYRRGVIDVRTAMLSTRAADAACAIAYVNLVGGQDELVFDGASMLFDHDGTLLARAPQFEEATLVVDVEMRNHYRERSLDPRGRVLAAELPTVSVAASRSRAEGEHVLAGLAELLDPVAEVYSSLVLGTKDYVEKNCFGDVVLGVSGGIDSALVAAIAVDALGPDRVHAVAMPSRYSSQGSIDDARDLADRLRIDFRIIPIESAHAAFIDLLTESFANAAPNVAEENIQARARGTLIMALSNKFGWLVLTTGNKSEIAVGYATLYGDMAGGFAVIKDVPKTLVYELAEHVNTTHGKDVIPQAIIDKPPSAELRPNQRDDDSLPPYDVLDPILEAYVERDLSGIEIVAMGYDRAVVARVLDLVDHAEYKRRQAPIGPRVTSRAFGKDRRMPITNRFGIARATELS